MSKKKATVIDGLISVETPDTSGEVLVVKGCNIETLDIDGPLNYEHKSESDSGASFNDIVGKCIKAKKIYSAEDCANERERMYWDMFKLPMIYGQFRLYDDQEDHVGAKAAAAIMWSHDEHKEPQLLRLSIEGSTIRREGNRLEETIARAVALTRKPASHAAVTGILKGETKPKTLLDEISEDAKKFEAVTGYERLGGHGIAKIMPLEKMDAGFPTAAPGQLTGGAALQVEQLHGTVKKELNKKGLLTVVKTILRDSDSLESAKAAIKHELGDMSPEFVKLFDNLADEWVVKKAQREFLTKAEGDAAAEEKYKSTLKRLGSQGATLPPKETAPKTHVRKVKKGGTYFDEDKGVLYAPGAAYKFYIPQDENYEELFHHPELQNVHDTALKNWTTLHRLYKSGKLPDEVVALAGLFSSQSPNTAVPLQELSYAHWMDMKAKGFDPAEPGEDAEQRWGPEYYARAASRQPPEADKELFGPGTPVRTKSGDLPIVGLPKVKLRGAISYGAIHQILKTILGEGKSGREISAELNALKHKNNIADEGEAGEEGKGFAPKTIRYLLGMSGIGDVHVPDTHFIRHSFGLHKDDPTNKKIKAILWQPYNEPALAAMDRFYYKNHPAVQYTKDRLRSLGIEDDFGEHLIFPSFWAHWLSIAPHERLRGWSTGQASNEGTDHAVFFNSVKRALNRRGIPFNVARLAKSDEGQTDSMPARIADAVKEIEDQWGPELAQFAFYSHMVPALLANTHHLQKAVQSFDKLEALAKNMLLMQQPQRPVVDVEKHGLPGLAHSPEQRNLVHGLDLESQPQPVSQNMLESAVEGMNESLTNQMVRKGNLKYAPRLLKSPAGRVAFVKPSPESHLESPGLMSAASREAAFHMLAGNYFGMGSYVPTTAAFQHPIDGYHLSAQEFVPGAGHVNDGNVIEHLGDTGVLDKAAIMDTILHNADRHSLNYLTSSVPPYLHLIDNGMSFSGSAHKRPYPPEYLATYGGILTSKNKPELANLHPKAQAWLMSLNPQELREKMHALGIPGPFVVESVRRLREMQARVHRGPVTKNGIITAPFWKP